MNWFVILTHLPTNILVGSGARIQRLQSQFPAPWVCGGTVESDEMSQVDMRHPKQYNGL